MSFNMRKKYEKKHDRSIMCVSCEISRGAHIIEMVIRGVSITHL